MQGLLAFLHWQERGKDAEGQFDIRRIYPSKSTQRLQDVMGRFEVIVECTRALNV